MRKRNEASFRRPRSSSAGDGCLKYRSSLYRSYKEGEHGQGKEDDEQDLRDRGGHTRQTAEPERRSRKRQNEEDKSPSKHGGHPPDLCRRSNASVRSAFRHVTKPSPDAAHSDC
jgi:hypothetical protein